MTILYIYAVTFIVIVHIQRHIPTMNYVETQHINPMGSSYGFQHLSLLTWDSNQHSLDNET